MSRYDNDPPEFHCPHCGADYFTTKLTGTQNYDAWGRPCGCEIDTEGKSFYCGRCYKRLGLISKLNNWPKPTNPDWLERVIKMQEDVDNESE